MSGGLGWFRIKVSKRCATCAGTGKELAYCRQCGALSQKSQSMAGRQTCGHNTSEVTDRCRACNGEGWYDSEISGKDLAAIMNGRAK